MLQIEEQKQALRAAEPDLKDLASALGIDALRKEIAELDEQAADPDFWNDMENSQKVLKRSGSLKATVSAYEQLVSLFEDAQTMIEMAEEDGDESMLPDIDKTLKELNAKIDEQRLSTLLSGEYDGKNAILTFHAGAGGTEAQDWVEMLYRMYMRWGERHEFKVSVLDYLEGEEAGIKSASIMIEGFNAYGYLKSEAGVHRLVRVSPFDASGRRHTSFASVEVMPVERRGRPEGQQDRLSRAHHPPAHRHRRLLPGGAQPVPEQGRRHADAQIQAHPDQGAGASRKDRGHPRRPEGDRLGRPDPLLRLHALHPGQGPPHRL